MELLVTRDGTLEVRAPLHFPQSGIDRFVEEKRNWIEEKTRESALRSQSRGAFSVRPGDKLLLLGREYPVCSGDKTAFDGTAFFIPACGFEELRPQLELLYRSLGKEYLPRRAAYFAGLMGVSPAAVKIGGACTCWGSCSAKDSIVFTWKLMMAPPETVDYVVVHELAHLREHNHSPRFWRVVESVLPDYRERKEKLKPLQRKLAAEAWE